MRRYLTKIPLLLLFILLLLGVTSAFAEKNSNSADRFFTTSDGVKLHYRVEGSGPALVIFPGLGQNGSNFNQVYEGLKPFFTIYTLDYR